mmetsp:Transcript_26163/g.84681  ORF Transcript_26163/g.84681 Transcript_26163/m.84681 type:complete len:218 (-) Transcript_26163:378-1031(-)
MARGRGLPGLRHRQAPSRRPLLRRRGPMDERRLGPHAEVHLTPPLGLRVDGRRRATALRGGQPQAGDHFLQPARRVPLPAVPGAEPPGRGQGPLGLGVCRVRRRLDHLQTPWRCPGGKNRRPHSVREGWAPLRPHPTQTERRDVTLLRRVRKLKAVLRPLRHDVTVVSGKRLQRQGLQAPRHGRGACPGHREQSLSHRHRGPPRRPLRERRLRQDPA